MTDRPDFAGFLRDLLDTWHEHYCTDIDGGDFQELLIKHGLYVERPATAEEAEQDEYADFEVLEGDVIVAATGVMSQVRRGHLGLIAEGDNQ